MSHRMWKMISAIGLVVAIGVAGCSSTSPTPTPTASKSQPAAATPAPAASGKESASSSGAASSGDVTKGKTVFAANCAVCHGQNAEGGMGPDLRKIGSKLDRDSLDKFIRDPSAVKPGTAMPKLPLSDQDRGAVVDFLQTMK
ncbi:MAG: cytochrome c [Chloroflexi bacterium]|nr:cytochrome c [Chloroflexota bacterium]